MVNHGESGIETENFQVTVLLCYNRNMKKVLSPGLVSLFFSFCYCGSLFYRSPGSSVG